MGMFGEKSCFEDRLRGSLNLKYVSDRNGACAMKPCIPASSLCDLSSLGLGRGRGKAAETDIYSSDLDCS